MLRHVLPARRRRVRSRSYRPAVWLLEDRSLPSFLGPASYAVPGDASDVAAGDFNGDGIPDLAVPSSSAGTVSILLGRGDGAFQSAVRYGAGDRPSLIVAGDFNGDGITDLAVANSTFPTGTVSVLLGNGDGSFQAPRSYACGLSPVGLVAGDFTGDGVLDLAVANDDGVGPDYRGSVHVLLGNGDGSFQAPIRYGAGVAPLTLAAGDFNGDGTLDLAVANEGIGTAGSDSSISVLTGVGDGSFQAAVDYAPGIQPVSLAVGDFTGGLPDLVVGRYLVVGGYHTSLVTVLRNRGDGSFEVAGDSAAGGDPSALVVGDFNGDGLPDLAIANHFGETLSVLSGNGDGTFRPPVSYAAGWQPGRLAVADLNGDGAPDLVVTNTLTSSVSVFRNQGDGSFQASVEMNPGTGGVVTGDFNGDGVPDLVAPNYDNPGTVSVLLGNGNGTFQAGVRYDAGPVPIAVAVADFTGNGIQDLAVANEGTPVTLGSVSILLGNGDGTFRRAGDYLAGSEPRAIVVGDFDGDGTPDLAVANYVSGTISVLLGKGDGTFAPAPSFGSGPVPLSLATGDFNGDGVPDLVVVNQGNPPDYVSSVNVFLGNGDGTFRSLVAYTAAARSGFVTVGDFNSDGIADLAVANRNAGTVGIWRGNGDGTFKPPVSYAASAFANFIAVGDFNGDGLPDLAVSGVNAITILLGQDDGTFTAPRSYLGGDEPGPIAVGSFTGNSLPDLAVSNGGGLIVLRNAGDWGPAAPAVRRAARTGSRVQALPPPVPGPWSAGRLALALTAADPGATLPGSATVPDPGANPRPSAAGSLDLDRPLSPQTAFTPLANWAGRRDEELGSVGWDNVLVNEGV